MQPHVKHVRANDPRVWHPFASKFEGLPIIDRRTLRREGDELRRRIEGKRILEVK
jgi:hypothetical protein